jgi:hypothetical protein
MVIKLDTSFSFHVYLFFKIEFFHARSKHSVLDIGSFGTSNIFIRFQVLTAASMKVTSLFWDIAPCSLVEVDVTGVRTAFITTHILLSSLCPVA